MRDNHETSHGTWLKWLIDAIHKVRNQKQRPSLERIQHAVRQHHSKCEDSTIEEHLELCVKEGSVLKVYNKGLVSYKDPGAFSRQLKVTSSTDLTKVIIKALRELGDKDGSPVKSIEKYIRHSHSLDLGVDVDFAALLKVCVKRAVSRGLVLQEGRLYRVAATAAAAAATTSCSTPCSSAGSKLDTSTESLSSPVTPKKKKSVTLEEETPKSKEDLEWKAHRRDQKQTACCLLLLLIWPAGCSLSYAHVAAVVYLRTGVKKTTFLPRKARSVPERKGGGSLWEQ
ncbi:hypothetical protein B566_EDAN016344 [Ephemera danica]|nr:hypothetical protein B566_EDAN016344 [Ephemera danica]